VLITFEEINLPIGEMLLDQAGAAFAQSMEKC
jgi:hypothetical protein